VQRVPSVRLVTLCILVIAASVGAFDAKSMITRSATQSTHASSVSQSNDRLPGLAIYDGATYLISDLGATGSCRGPDGYVPCFGGLRDQAVMFNCLRLAESPSGCLRDVVSSSNPQYRYEIIVWIFRGSRNDSSSLNCYWQSSGDMSHYYYSHCVSIDASSFIVAEEPNRMTF
jgi:hypothetical protein